MSDNISTQKRGTDGQNHDITVISRKHIKITGVKDVIGFDGYYVELDTVCGHLFIDGEDIKINTLDTDSGIVELDGSISALTYSDGNGKEKKSIFKRNR